MADLISRDLVLQGIAELMQSPWYNQGNGCEYHDQYLTRKEAVDVVKVLCVEKAPAVDAAPVTHARWIEYPECLGYDGAYSDDHIVCSNCHSVWSIMDNDTDGFDFCPHCGAQINRREPE